MEDTVFEDPQPFGNPQDELGGIPGGIAQLYRSTDSTRQGVTVTADQPPSVRTPGPMSMSPRAEFATPGRMEGATVTAEQPDGAVVTAEGPLPNANPASPAQTAQDSTGVPAPPEVNPEAPTSSFPTRPAAAEPTGQMGRNMDEPETGPRTMSFPGATGTSASEAFENRDETLPEASTQTTEQRRREIERSSRSFAFDGQTGPTLAQVYEQFRTGGTTQPSQQTSVGAPSTNQNTTRNQTTPQNTNQAGNQDEFVPPYMREDGQSQSAGQPTPPQQTARPSPGGGTPQQSTPQQNQGNTSQSSPQELPSLDRAFALSNLSDRYAQYAQAAQQNQNASSGQSSGGGSGGGAAGTKTREQVLQEEQEGVRSPSSYMEDMVAVGPNTTQEEVNRLLEQGKTPFFSSVSGEAPEYEAIDLDLSGQKNAIREFADAKIRAAKQGVATGEENVKAANARLLANAFGPGLFQALTGTRQPTNQTTNFARSARKAGRELREAEQRAAQVEQTANAEAQQQIATLNSEEALRQAQDKRKMKQLNAEIERNRNAARAELNNNMLSRAFNMSERDRQLARKRAADRLDFMESQQESQSVNGATYGLQEINRQLRSINETTSKLRQLSNTLNREDLSDSQEQAIKMEIQKQIPTKESSSINMMGNKQIQDQVSSRIESLRSRKEGLSDDVPQMMQQADDPRVVQEYIRLRNQTPGMPASSSGVGTTEQGGLRSPDEVLNQPSGTPRNQNPDPQQAGGQDDSTEDNTEAATNDYFNSVFQ